MRRVFFEWLGLIDPSLRQAMRRSLLPWFGTAAIALAVILLCGAAPGAAAYFGLDAEKALWVWLVTFGSGVGAAWVDRRVGFSPGVYGLVFLASCGLVLIFAAALAALSRPPGSFVLAGVFVLTAGYYGHMHRSTARYPFGLGLVVIASLAALALIPGADGWSLFAVAVPIALGANWLLGTIAFRAHEARLQDSSLRAALQAQILEAQSRDLERMSEAMLYVLQTTHDASNALTTAMFNAETLRKGAEARSRGEAVTADECEVASDLTEQLARLRALVNDAKGIGHRGEPAPSHRTSVAVLPVVGAAIRELRSRFPTVGFDSSISSHEVRVLVSDGASSLHRIIENLGLNACQGDGTRGASRVEVRVTHTDVGNSVAVQVRDDGPGFSRAQLAAPIAAFESSRPAGTGLGLFTAERLARASGGSLARENRPGGGAVVTVYLAGGTSA